ncbi:MAG TPA: 4-oxalocrotonate tautomerase DmpI [Patescibacteria group bacterium]|nr:4-oxalocrotonate tautomerase DmpI [Patescibacteria group bacterium]
MPVITIETGNVSREKKQALIERLTKASSEILGIPEQSFVVLINEYEDDNIGTGGEVLTAVKARRMAAKG